METQLGLFEGTAVEAARLTLSGASDERVGKMAMGEEIFLVVKAVVHKVSHGEEKVNKVEQFTRTHKAGITAMFMVDKGAGERMLMEASMLSDEQFGISNLFTTHSDEGLGHIAGADVELVYPEDSNDPDDTPEV